MEPQQLLHLCSEMVSNSNTTNLMKEANSSHAHWEQAVGLHGEMVGLLKMAIPTEIPGESSSAAHYGEGAPLLEKLEALNNWLDSTEVARPALLESANKDNKDASLALSGGFSRIFDRCKQYLDPRTLGDLDAAKAEGISRMRNAGGKTAEKVLFELIKRSGKRIATNPSLEYAEEFDIPILIREILIDEVYSFKSKNKSPVIIDGGANVGLGIFYFKHLYPESKIIGFEPNPELYNILVRNIRDSGWKNVCVYPYALGGMPGTAKLQVPANMPMGGSLTNRLSAQGRYEIIDYDVDVAVLSSYIKEENISFLKLDIEGVELDVLEECEPSLRKVHSMFIEFHFGGDLDRSRLPRLLSLLVRNSFDYTLTGGHFDAYDSRPFDYMGAASSGKSLNIHATKKRTAS